MIKIKYSFFLISLLFSYQLYSQSELIQGKITNESDVEGIHILNTTSRYNATTDENGHFSIKVKPLDTLLISSIKYIPEKILITNSIFEKGVLTVQLLELVNQLDEVVVNPYSLSGYLQEDINRIPTFNNNKEFSYSNLKDGLGYQGDNQSKLSGNVAESALNNNAIKDGLNFKNIFVELANLILTKKSNSNSEESQNEYIVVGENLRQRFSTEFLETNFDIPEDKAVDFLFFAEENGLTKNMLKSENELELIQFLLKKSEEFKQHLDKN